MARRYQISRPVAQPTQIPYEKHLNPEQFRAVTAREGPLLVLAGPGSGKTRTLTYRVAFLLEQGVDPRQILLVTFTVKAAREMLNRVEQILKARPEGLWGGTFHHIGNLILRQHAQRIGRTTSFGILDEEDSKDLIAGSIADLKISTTQTRFPQANVVEAMLSLSINTCRPLSQVVAERYPQFEEHLGFLERAQKRYQERKERANVVDYDDLLFMCLTLFREHPDIREPYAKQFRHILVDEYQDTNRLQFELIRELGSFHHNVFVVGDDAQAIYSFRGAEVKNLLEFPQTFPGARTERLETNYRSSPQILRLANASIEFNKKQFPKELKSTHDSGPLPAVVPLVDAKQQAVFIAQRILEFRREGTPLKEMAILFRARFQAAELELEMAKRNIPYVVRGGLRFFEQAHIKDVLAYVRITVNPHDELAWERVLRLQEGIGIAYARRIWETLQGKPQPLQQALQETLGLSLPSRASAGWKRLCQTFRSLSTQGKGPLRPAEMILGILHAGYAEHLKTHFEDSKDRREDLEQLINLAANYESADRLIEDVTLREPFKGETIRGWDNPDEFLVLSTIHQAKGLEWGVVFLIGLVEGQFPHPKSLEDPADLEEERRLFYVAVTRTKRALYLTYPLTRYSYQRGEILMRPSLFLQELPEDLCELWRVSEETTSLELPDD